MGKRQDWSVAACVFLLLSLASQIYCTSETHFSRSKLGVGSSGEVLSPKEKDLIKKLPGQPSNVNFRQYGGHVAVNETAGRFLYYYFVESIKPSNSTPLVLWLNGGPGCSSLQSVAFKGMGPFRVLDDSKTLLRNPYSWNNEANILFLESPAAVGFSYSKTLDAIQIAEQGDTLSAEDNYMFLVNWLERFPEYKRREIFITGQSYAGHHGPQLAQIILRRNNQTFINLRGMMIGAPALDVKAIDDSIEGYLKSRGVFVDNVKLCNEWNIDAETYDMEKCMDMDTMHQAKLEYVDLSNIHSPKCLNSTSSIKPKKCRTIMDIDPCVKNYIHAYLNKRKVQEAIHAIANTTKLPYPWTDCNDEMNTNWNETEKEASMIPVLHELIGKSLRMMFYSGDLDAVVPFTATLATLKDMNLTVVNDWRSWFTEGQVGGYTLDYKGNLSYAIVRGAGHGVTRDHPIRALTLFTSFIHNTPLPKTP
ncbi:PREDICTED: serine carboxypeptidase-like 38 [Camelina sativa]|uniref:Serine carboxypeptidase-like 38 n=1 Tax=Camelina sativa TaxID=90675 RepID=A0ABM0TI81_CAMSA|nr:PREDICTED: serine carboxypeptidase-like 38 [Camelina sativa]